MSARERSDLRFEVVCTSLRYCPDRDGLLAFADVMIDLGGCTMHIQGVSLMHGIGHTYKVQLPAWKTPYGTVRPVIIGDPLHDRVKHAVIDEYLHQLARRPRRRM